MVTEEVGFVGESCWANEVVDIDVLEAGCGADYL